MFSLTVRMILCLWRAWRAPRTTHLEESVLRFRVMPDDLDFNLHMNNGRYLSLMDLGRTDLVVRAGLLRAAWRRRWRPVLGGATIRYRRSLRPLQRFELRTRLLGWDDRWFVFEQRFVADGQIYALAIARGVFVGEKAGVPPQETLAAIAVTIASPALPAYVATWGPADDEAWRAATAPISTATN
ncbi:MAG TPA: thioesterase family protein [Polyangia bacterium]